MKKSKIIGLSLGFVTLTSTIMVTPFIVTSCKNNDSKDNDKNNNENNNQINILINEKALGTRDDYKKIRKEGNDFQIRVNADNFSNVDVNQAVIFSENITDYISREELQKYGFDLSLLDQNNSNTPEPERFLELYIGKPTAINNKLDYSDNTEAFKYLENKMKNSDPTKEFLFYTTIKIIQWNWKDNENVNSVNEVKSEKEITIPFNLWFITNQYK